MDVYEAVASRMSCRAFLDKPVPHEILERILEAARRAPSGGNVQPWHVDMVMGVSLAALKAKVAAKFDTLPKGEGTEYQIYPDPMGEPYMARRRENGADLYGAVGIAWDDRDARRRQFERNFVLFDAPVGLFLSINRDMQPGQWADLGVYLQTIMLLARAEGLHSCAQEAWAAFPQTVGDHLGMPGERMLFCGVSLGYADEAHPVNKLVTRRAVLDEYVHWHG